MPSSKSRSSSAKRPALAKKTSADVNLGRRLFASLQEQLEQKAQTIAHKDAEIEQLKEKVASLQSAIDQTAKKGLSRQVQRLKSQVDEKEKQLQVYTLSTLQFPIYFALCKALLKVLRVCHGSIMLLQKKGEQKGRTVSIIQPKYPMLSLQSAPSDERNVKREYWLCLESLNILCEGCIMLLP